MTTTTTNCLVVTSWGKEHQLTTTELIKEGDVIVAETPLVSVLDANPKYTTYAWDLVDKLLSSADLMQRYYASRLKVSKFSTDMEDQQIERNLAKKHRYTRDMVKTIYFGVATNNIGYKDAHGQVIGHGIYPIISRANHSCRPNATHKPGNIETREVSLVAVRDIQSGEAVTWNYANTPIFNDADYTTRNFNLMNTFNFVCNCERCKEEIPLELVDMPNLPRYFVGLIRDEAEQYVRDVMKHQ